MSTPFHIMDPAWGHLTIKMSGHPPFGAQIMLNGYEYVACEEQTSGIGFAKEGNCFTRADEPERLAQVAGTLSQPRTIGRLSQVRDRWIYTACLCFGLDFAEQAGSCFSYAYSVYQVEYSRNLIFASGAVMERAFDTIVDRTRKRLDVPSLRTLFGVALHPRHRDADLSSRQAVVIERPRWNLTLFKVHFGRLTLKGYTKGEHVLRFEAIVHNTRALHTGRLLENFPAIVARLAAMVDRFTNMLDCLDVAFLPDGILDQLPTSSQIGATRVGGVDINKPRARAAMAAVLALAVAPDGFTVGDLAVRRSPDGHQTTILTNRTDLSAAQIACRMAARWRQENYFKYAREHFALDALDSYADHPDDLTRLVPNPAKARAADQVNGARTDLIAAHADMAHALDTAAIKAGRRGNGGKATVDPAAGQALGVARDDLAAAKAASRNTPSHL